MMETTEGQLDAEIAKHQQRLDEMEDRIGTMEVHGETHAERLRRVHERVSGDFARLRQAFGDDWARIRHDAEEGWHELVQEMSAVDATLFEFHDEDVATFNEGLDRISDELEEVHTADQASRERRLAVDERGVAELRAQIAAAKERARSLPTLPEGQRQTETEAYKEQVRAIRARWARLKQRGAR
jgi:hypothetical protein